MFFSTWAAIARVAVVGALAYIGLVALLRISGKRTLAKMNAFDLVVTVSLGSILATVLLSKQTVLAEGITAFATLIALQFVTAWLSARSGRVRRLVSAQPTLLYSQGEFLHEALRRERVTEDEVRAAVRAQGIAAMEAVRAVVLETDGSFTALNATNSGSCSALRGVRGAECEVEGH